MNNHNKDSPGYSFLRINETTVFSLALYGQHDAWFTFDKSRSNDFTSCRPATKKSHIFTASIYCFQSAKGCVLLLSRAIYLQSTHELIDLQCWRGFTRKCRQILKNRPPNWPTLAFGRGGVNHRAIQRVTPVILFRSATET